MKTNPFRISVVLFAALLLVACSALQGGLKQPSAVPSTEPPQNPRSSEKVQGHAGQTKKIKQKATPAKPTFDRKTVRLHLEEGDFQAALKLVESELARGIPQRDLSGEYLQSLNGAIEQAQVLLAGDEPARAGRLFRTALDTYPEDAGLTQVAGLQSTELEAALKICADKLMEKGLVAYRVGDLGRAIDIWKEALSFYPDHQNCQKAIQTTYAQLANLEKITTDQSSNR